MVRIWLELEMIWVDFEAGTTLTILETEIEREVCPIAGAILSLMLLLASRLYWEWERIGSHEQILD